MQASDIPAPPTPDTMSRKEYALAREMAQTHLFAGTTPQERPKAIVLAGQPGSGKSRLTRAASAEMAEQGGAVIIDTDQLREYHPRYRTLAEADYTTAATKVQKDAARLTEDVRRTAITEKRNIIVDGTLNNADRAERLMQKLKESGYEIDVRAMAVHEPVSQRGVAARLEKGLANPDIIPRNVEPHIQADAFQGMPQSIDRIEQQGLADRVRVYGRDKTAPLYDSAQAPGTTAVQAIAQERTRPLTPLEISEQALDWDMIVQRATARQAPPSDMAAYKAAQKDAHVQLRQDTIAAREFDAQATPEQRQQSLSLAAPPGYAIIQPAHGAAGGEKAATAFPAAQEPATATASSGQPDSTTSSSKTSDRPVKKDNWHP